MHILQPKHTKLSEKEISQLLEKLNITKGQLPKIKIGDPALPKECKIGDVVKIEREDGIYYRVVVPD